MEHAPLSDLEEAIAKDLVDSAFAVHSRLGPGLLEHVYEVCLCHELTKRGRIAQRQVPVSITYDEHVFDEGLRLDVLVDDLVICELKSVETVLQVHVAQTLSQLKLTGKRLAFLINFNVPLIKDGIRRLIL